MDSSRQAKVLLSLFFALFSVTSIAQSQSLIEALVEMFSTLDKSTSKIRTGYLYDLSPDYVDMERFDGTVLVDSNYVDLGIFGGFLHCLNAAKVNSVATLYNADSITDQLLTEDIQTVNLGVALFEYDYIVSNALTENLIAYSGGKVYDVYDGGVWQNPYNQRYACLITTGCQIVEEGNVNFVFDPDGFYWGNIEPDSLYVDLGHGYELVTSGLSKTYYCASGSLDIKLKAVLDEDTVLLSHSNLIILAPSVQPSSVGFLPDHIDNFKLTFGSEEVSAKVSYKYASGHNQLVRPLIYVEGFDIPMQIDWDLIRSIITGGAGGQSYYSFIEDVSRADSLSAKYDFVYVDWKNPRADIRANATLLEDIIGAINTLKHQSGSDERNVIVGHSMGGLVVRYALVDMENHQVPVPHETDYYISYDAPHLGANLPIGFQHTVRDLLLFLNSDGFSGTFLGYLAKQCLEYASSFMNSKSAKQMLYRRVALSGNEDNTEHNIWQSALSELGFPKGDRGHSIENIAIVNGNVLGGWKDGQIIDADIMLHRDLLFKVGRSMRIALKVDRTRVGNNKVSELHITFTKPFSWLPNSPFVNTTLLYVSHNDNYSDNEHLYDLAPSSFIHGHIPNTVLSYGDFHGIDSLQFAFIPAASALAVEDYSLDRDFYETPPLPLVDTPFSSFFVWNSPQGHALGFRWHEDWLNDQMRMSINGPRSIVQSGDVFSIINGNDNTSQWSSSASIICDVNNLGVVSVHDNDLVMISYKDSTDYIHPMSNTPRKYTHHKHRKVLAGIPSDFHISCQEIGNSSYKASASCNNSEINSFLDDCCVGGSLAFYWGLKTGFNSIVWSSSSLRSYEFPVTLPSTLFFKLVDDSNREYIFQYPQKLLPYANAPTINYDPRIIYIWSGNAYLSYSFILPSIDADEYLYVWESQNHPYSHTPDRIIIGNQSIMLDTSMVVSINGVDTTVYCFNILDSAHIQSVIANIDNYSGNTEMVTVKLCSGPIWLEDLSVTITKGYPVLN